MCTFFNAIIVVVVGGGGDKDDLPSMINGSVTVYTNTCKIFS